jgi:hypothetical protein
MSVPNIVLERILHQTFDVPKFVLVK